MYTYSKLNKLNGCFTSFSLIIIKNNKVPREIIVISNLTECIKIVPYKNAY